MRACGACDRGSIPRGDTKLKLVGDEIPREGTKICENYQTSHKLCVVFDLTSIFFMKNFMLEKLSTDFLTFCSLMWSCLLFLFLYNGVT